MIGMMFDSASHTHADCRKVVVTDEQTSFQSREGVEVFRTGFDSQLPSLARSKAWVEFLRQTAPDSHIVFLDYDVIIQQNLEHVFDQCFDVGLTYREHFRWPINAGIQFLHAARLSRALELYKKVVTVSAESYQDWVVWAADQHALRDLVCADFAGEGPCLHRKNGFEFLLLPCCDYNYSADRNWDLANASYHQKKVLHFKGHHKPAMFAYWRTHFGTETGAPFEKALSPLGSE